MINEVLNQKDLTSPEKDKNGVGFEIAKGPKTVQAAKAIENVLIELEKNNPIHGDEISNINEVIQSLKVNVGGEEFSIEELKNNPELRQNFEIWKEIKAGNFKNYHKLKYITPEIAEHLYKHKGSLHLWGLTAISDTTAELLSNYQGNLDLSQLTAISDTTAEHLSKHQGELDLRGLTAISDTTAEHLSKHQGYLDLSGLTVISDSVAKYLSGHQGQGGLSLLGLTVISAISAKHLAKIEGELFIGNNIRTQTRITDQHKL